MTAFDAWLDKARSVRIEDEAARRGIKLRGKIEREGPCPKCGGDDRFAINVAKQIFNCRGCGVGGDVIDLVRHLDAVDFFAACAALTGEPAPEPSGAAYPANNRATVQPGGLTLEQYAAAKVLPVAFLREHGLSDVSLAGRSAVRFSAPGARNWPSASVSVWPGTVSAGKPAAGPACMV
jgi:hypothetical protein